MIVALRRLAVGVGMIAALTSAVTPTARPAEAATPGFNALPAPQRVLDTRPSGSTADGAHARSGAVAGGTVYALPIAGRVGVPADVDAAVLNVTVAEPADAGFVTVYPCGGAVPTASNVNYTAGQTVPNAVIAAPGDGGAVCLFTKATTHLIVDVSGWFTVDSYAALTNPARLYDSRPGRSTVDGQQAGEGLRGPETETRLKVADRAGLGPDPGSVVLNVTATETQGPGFATVYPCGVQRPNASNLNYLPNQTVPNLVVAKVGTNGEVCVFTKAAAHLVVDVAGALDASIYTPLDSPQRLLDTRPSGATADSQFAGAGTQPARGSLQLDVTRAGVPDDASAVVLNVTAVGPQGPGYLATHPGGTQRPNASNVNYDPGQTIANAVVARVGAGGAVCVFNLAPTDVVVDVAGYLTGPAPAATGDPCPGTVPTDPNAVAAIVRRPALHQAIGVDHVALVACDVGQSWSRGPIDVAALADWANQHVAPWYAAASRGRFTVQFSAHPNPRIAVVDEYDCMDRTAAMTEAPFTNVIGVTEEDWGGGQAGPGSISGVRDTSVLAAPPAVTSRGGYVGGGAAFVDPSVFVHELGHTIHWPHSYLSAPFPDEYNNPVDVMSGEPDPPPRTWQDGLYCPIPGSIQVTSCWAQNTLAFNRVAAGWVDAGQIALHRSGHVNYLLDRPAGDGVQLVALPDPADPYQLMTIEARPTTGADRYNEVAGVAIHLVDQSGDGLFRGVSLNRRQQQALGAPNTYEHVLAPGQSVTVHGVTVTVHTGGGGEGYAVSVRGTYRSPGPLADDRPRIATQSVDDVLVPRAD